MAYKGFDLQGRVAVVVGGTSGIGLTIGLGLADAGADVVPSGRRADLVDSAAKEVESVGRRSLRHCSDVRDRASLEKLLNATVKEFGKVDILVYAAGRTKRTPFLEVEEREWNDIMDTNLTGAYRVSQIFGRHMVERKYGRVIHIASLTSFVGMHEVAAYAASKSGLAALTRTTAIEWAKYGVCVNAIAPGVFRTALNEKLLDGTPRGQELLLRTPMRRFGKVEELVGSAIFLASDAASFVTGTLLQVDGGFLASGVNQ
ncbi:MAG TPA: SDR family oxidoreductase [Candidatus Acidoferrales bacterium]|jgi:NAD(P)-dependent dehydrogenase (short-subunit alcohol dehydrogenase family)|nr:SDR family oxidoreductase [Candidatus Acidoferrales bacterium]